MGNDVPPLIPWPLRATVDGTHCPLRTLPVVDASARPEAQAVRAYLERELGLTRATAVMELAAGTTGTGDRVVIKLRLDAAHRKFGDEGYRLSVLGERIEIGASTPAGLFYGCQSLLQIVEHALTAAKPGQAPVLCGLVIEDRPRFPWRGLHLDVSRHYFPVGRVKEAIDWCARLKLNRFHWHLTDDQGWRLPVPALPRLTEIGAWRTEADGTRYGGFYSESEIRDVVAHAAERFVTVVPEVDFPGHARAAIAAYPELSCRGAPLPVPSSWGVFDDILCAGNDEVLRFVETVLGEVARLFPGPYLHIGGDEAPGARWRECPRCRTRLATLPPPARGARDRDAVGEAAPSARLQAWLTRRVCKLVRDLGRTPVGWDEILDGGLAPGTAVAMAWRSLAHAAAAARAGHQVIACPQEHCYLDSYQGPRESEPPAFPRDVPLAAACAFDPVPQGLPPDAAARILGGQANIWTEYMPTWEQVHYMAFPRLYAIAEALWSEGEQSAR